MAVIALRLTMVALMLTFAQIDFAQDRPVARVGERVISFREISCELHAANFAEIAAKQQRDPAEVCLEREQQRLQLLVAGELFDTAIRKLGIEPSAAELAEDSAFHGYGEAEFTRLSERYRAMGRAALRIRNGEHFDAVYQGDVKKIAALPEKEFRRFVDLLPTADAAERFVERHSPEHFRATIAADARQRIGKTKLMQILSTEAEKRGVPFGAYAVAFWRELAAEIGLEVLDPRYKPISLEELSWQPQTSNTP